MLCFIKRALECFPGLFLFFEICICMVKIILGLSVIEGELQGLSDDGQGDVSAAVEDDLGFLNRIGSISINVGFKGFVWVKGDAADGIAFWHPAARLYFHR